MGTRDGHLDFHTAPELFSCRITSLAFADNVISLLYLTPSPLTHTEKQHARVVQGKLLWTKAGVESRLHSKKELKASVRPETVGVEQP